MASKQPRFKSTLLPCLGLDAEKIQLPESASEGHPRADDSASKIWKELPQEAIKKSINSVCKYLTTCINAKGGLLEHTL